MNNLKKAKMAIQGKRKFRIRIKEEKMYWIDVEASNEKMAESLALTEHANENTNLLRTNQAEVYEKEEITDYDKEEEENDDNDDSDDDSNDDDDDDNN